MKSVSSVMRRVARRVLLPAFGPRVARHAGMILPPRHLRFCGLEFKDHAFYLASARAEVARLREHCGLTDHSRVLDVGCGSGRLAIALREQCPQLRSYLGVDVHRPSIEWCARWLTSADNQFAFQWIDLENSRYNPNGRTRPTARSLPCADASIDVINLFSVFSHLEAADIESYLPELRRVLAGGGAVFLTAFVSEDQADDAVVNPQTPDDRWSGPLHCVSLRRSWFEGLLRKHGFSFATGAAATEVDGQTAFYLRRASETLCHAGP